MDTWIQDLRSGLRSLVASRSTALLSLVCLGFGIGVNTMVFSIVNGVLLRPLPFEAPERLALVSETRRAGRLEITPVSYRNFRDVAERAAPVAELAAARSGGLSVSLDGEPVRYAGARVTWNLFRVLGVSPALGRGFRSDEDRPGAEPTVLLSDALWQQGFAGDAGVLGRVILVDGAPHTVIGVMPPHFAFPQENRLWVPLAPDEHDAPRERRTLAVYARLADGVSLEQAEARLAVIADDLAAEHPEANRDRGLLVRPLAALVSDRARSLLGLMMGAVGLVLLIACANVANLMLARGVTRRRELAIRGALGATRGRLLRQLLTESLLLGLASIPVGLAVARLGLESMILSVPEEVRTDTAILAIDARVLAFTVAVALVTSVVFGLLPSLQASRSPLRDTLSESGRDNTGGARQRRARNALVAAEVALSVVLLVGAGLFLESFTSGVRADVGFDTGPLMTLRFDMVGDRYASPEARARRVADVVERLEALPGVLAAAASDLEPLRGGRSRARAVVEHAAGAGDAAEAPTVLYGGVTSGFFETLAVPIVRGRGLGALEAGTRSEVAVVNQAMADRLWPGQNPVGERFRLDDDPERGWFTVIGVSRDTLSWNLSDRPWPTAFLPWPHVAVRDPELVLRVRGDPASVAAPAREVIRAADPTLPVFAERTMDEVLTLTFWRRRLLSGLFGSFGGFAVLLAAVGAYGVLSYWVGQRTREIGVRMALGAARGDVVWLIVRQGMAPVVAGIALGLLGAMALTRLLRGRVFELGATDAGSLATVLLVLGGVGLLSSYWPARRAAGVDPIRALRE